MTTKNLTDNCELNGPGTLENIFDIPGDVALEPTLPPHVATFLGEQLQAFYSRLMDEPIPDRFVQLLEQLNQKEDGSDGK